MAWVPTAPERYERTSREDPPFVPAGRRTSGELRWLESQHSQPGWRRRARTNTAASRAGGSLFPHRAAEVRLGVALCVARRIRPSLSSPRRRRGASRRRCSRVHRRRAHAAPEFAVAPEFARDASLDPPRWRPPRRAVPVRGGRPSATSDLPTSRRAPAPPRRSDTRDASGPAQLQ